jgi:hypothetical protein
MKKHNLVVMLSLAFALFASIAFAEGYRAVTISKPDNGAMVSSPVEICMSPWGVEVEPAKNGVNDGKGHNHILVDVELPDLNMPIAKDANHIHMGDGSSCKTIELSSGTHTIRTLFAQGNHMPYIPPLTDVITVTVK